MSQEKITPQMEDASENKPKPPPKLWVLKPACQNFVITEGKSASSLALLQISSTFKLCFEWGPTQWRWQVLTVTIPIPEFSPRTGSSGSCSPVGQIARVSPIVPSYPADIPGDTVQPTPKPASPHLQCLHPSPGMGQHLTSLLLTLIISNNHFCTKPPRFTSPELRIESSPRRVIGAYRKMMTIPVNSLHSRSV